MSTITVRVEKNNTNNVTLTVEDNDIGIKPEKPEKLFQKFFQIMWLPERHVGHRAWFGDMQRHSRCSQWENLGR
jgi:signal transduction histidine kinase